jgi:AraC-like DNA-binding protein
MITPPIQDSEHAGLGTSILTLNGDLAIRYSTGAEIAGKPVLVKGSTLLFVTKGALQVTHGTTNYSIVQNQMALLKKDILVKYFANSGQRTDDTQLILVYLKEDMLKDFVKQARLSVSPPEQSKAVTVDRIDPRLLKFLDSLHLYFDYGGIDENITRIKLLELLFNMASRTGPVLEQLMDLRQHFRTDITATIEDHLMDTISLPQLAKFSGRSLSSFKRDFVAIYNMSPSKWLRQRRLEKACELFRNTTMTVTDVCYTLGFENLAHFSRLFKAHFGCSPSRFS